MAHPPKVAYELSDAEKRDLVQLIQKGKALPEKYRFMLFEDKREVEVELVWNGKTREVCTTVLPFQSLEHVDEPRQEKPELGTLDMFDIRGRQLKGWTNKLIWGDNNLKSAGPAAISSKTNGSAFVRTRTTTWNLSPRCTSTPPKAATRWRSRSSISSATAR